MVGTRLQKAALLSLGLLFLPLAACGGGGGGGGGGVVTPPPPVDARVHGQIETQMGIGKEEHADRHAANVPSSVFLR